MQGITEHDVVELLKAVPKSEEEGDWPAGTVGTVVSERDEWKLVEISEDEPPGATLDMISVVESELSLCGQQRLVGEQEN